MGNQNEAGLKATGDAVTSPKMTRIMPAPKVQNASKPPKAQTPTPAAPKSNTRH